ncbi:MAG TPA: membrane protein insertion efficiency factor YidD [Phycisphaeraceae bacterium]|nr:membrane protein insertion efficiency factor YidD [Phycisphaeraceae bacterium]
MPDEKGKGKRASLPRRLVKFVVSLPSHGCILLIRIYQVSLGPFLGGQCRFQPTCSYYAIDAYREHGFWKGSYLAMKRILRCHPLGGSGYDPVPPKRDS